jgi:DNA-binding PadR family transcriptional regulator
MSTQADNERIALLQGTLDLLILRTLVFGADHGLGIARAIKAKWGVSSNNRRARFYELTLSGRKHLVIETSQWRKLVFAIGLVLGPEEVEG